MQGALTSGARGCAAPSCSRNLQRRLVPRVARRVRIAPRCGVCLEHMPGLDQAGRIWFNSARQPAWMAALLVLLCASRVHSSVADFFDPLPPTPRHRDAARGATAGSNGLSSEGVASVAGGVAVGTKQPGAEQEAQQQQATDLAAPATAASPEPKSHPLALPDDMFAAEELVAELTDPAAMGKRGELWLLAQGLAMLFVVWPPFKLAVRRAGAAGAVGGGRSRLMRARCIPVPSCMSMPPAPAVDALATACT